MFPISPKKNRICHLTRRHISGYFVSLKQSPTLKPHNFVKLFILVSKAVCFTLSSTLCRVLFTHTCLTTRRKVTYQNARGLEDMVQQHENLQLFSTMHMLCGPDSWYDTCSPWKALIYIWTEHSGKSLTWFVRGDR